MKYSIIIAVYNRIEEVKELLASAENLKFKRDSFEFLFVDDGSTDGFKDFIGSYTSASGLNIRAIYQQNKGPGAARNTGMQNADSSYFIFVDSDCMFPPHWLEAIDRAVEKYKWDTFGGPDTYHPSFSPLLKAINYSMTSYLGTGGTRGKRKSIGRFYPRSFNMGLHKIVFEKIGGMGKLRHGQDMDYSQRFFDAGFSVGLISDAYVYHKRRTSLFKFFRQIFNWGVARINLGVKYPSMLKIFHFFPAVFVSSVFLLIILSIILPLYLWVYFLIAYICINLWAVIESFIMYRSLKAAIYTPFVLNIQIIAYGLGLISACWQMKVLRKREATGFVKNYYTRK